MYLIIDNTDNKAELVNSVRQQDLDDSEQGIVTIIDLVGTPKKTITKYSFGTWEPVEVKE